MSGKAAGGGIDWETAIFCGTWSGLALIAWSAGGIIAGLAMLFGPLPFVAFAGWWFLRREGEVRTTRNVWWVILAVAAGVMALVVG